MLSGKPSIVLFAVVASSFVGFVGFTAADRPTRFSDGAVPAPPPKVKSTSKAQEKKDPNDGALPPGAVVRIGTRRLQNAASSCPLQYLSFTPDGKQLLTKDFDKPVLHRWDTATGGALSQPACAIPEEEVRYDLMSVSPNGHYWLVDAPTFLDKVELRGLLEIPFDWIHSHFRIEPAFGANLKEPLAFAIDLNNQALVQLLSKQLPLLFAFHTTDQALLLHVSSHWQFAPERRAAFAPNGKTVAIVDLGRKMIDLYDLPTLKRRCSLPTLQQYGRDPECNFVLCFSPDGRQLAAVKKAGELAVWDTTTGKQLAKVDLSGPPVYHAAFAPDGRSLAIAAEDGTFTVWELASGRERCILRPQMARNPDQGQGPESSIYGWKRLGPLVAFSPDGKFLAYAGYDRTVHVWDLATGKTAAQWRGHDDELLWIAFTPDGRRLASGSDDGTVLIWDTVGLSRSP